MKIAIFGSGYVGLVTGACLANLGHQVKCVDVDLKKIQKLNDGEIPFYEPGLADLVKVTREKGRLQFISDPAEAVKWGEAIFSCVGTPSLEDGSADLSYVFAVAETVGKEAEGFKILINKSTVPPGTARKCHNLIRKANPASKVEVVSNPEFLKEGNAVHDFTHPDKIVFGIGTNENEENRNKEKDKEKDKNKEKDKENDPLEMMKKIYFGLERPYLNMVETDWETAEMIKYANNSFLATKISFINEIANICDLIGADVKTVSRAIGMDYRIGPKFLNAGVGYGGSCFPKDIKAIIQVAGGRGYEAKLLKEVHELNERQKKIMIRKIRDHFGGRIKGTTLSLWGLSFKPKTSDIRDAASLQMIAELLKEGARINVYDPAAMEEVKKIFGDQINYFNSVAGSAENSSGLIVVTEWDEFRNIDLKEIGEKMKEKILFDGRNVYNPEEAREQGFKYYGVGRG